MLIKKTDNWSIMFIQDAEKEKYSDLNIVFFQPSC